MRAASRDADEELGRELAALAAVIDYPPTPPVAGTVAARLRATTPPRRDAGAVRPQWRSAFGRGLVLALIASLLVVGAAVAVRWGLGGVNFRFAQETATPLGSATSSALGLGEEVSVQEVGDRVGFRIVVPSLEALGAPDGVYLTRVPSSGGVALVYADRPEFPVNAATGAGIVVTEFRRDIGPDSFEKLINQGVRVQNVTVNGTPGYWIAGGTHMLIYRDEHGDEVFEETRLVSDTLIWEQDRLTLRIENAPDLDAALRIAESMR
jgi:hypothetical protein